MSTIRSVRDTFQTLIAEIKAAKSDLSHQINQATLVRGQGHADVEHILLNTFKADSVPANWTPSTLKTEVQDCLTEVIKRRQKFLDELAQATPKDLFADRHTLARMKSDEATASDQVNTLQREFTRALESLPLELRTRWSEKLITTERSELLDMMTPPPSRWNLTAQMRASVEQRAMWAILRAHDAKHGPGSLSRHVEHLGELQADIAKTEAPVQAQALQRHSLEVSLTTYDDLQTQADRMSSVADIQQKAVLTLLLRQKEEALLDWIKTQAPDQVKPYLFACAKMTAPNRVIKALSAQNLALEGIEKKLSAPMDKLNKGVRRAPSKYISVDEDKIASDVRAALKKMKPLGTSAQAAINAVAQLHVEPESVSQTRFYQKALSAPAVESNNWLLMWLLLDGQFNPAGALLATGNPALALGMASLIPSWNQDSWNSVNTIPDSIDPAHSSSIVPAIDWGVPSDSWVNPTDGLAPIPQGDFSMPSLSGSDGFMPGIDVPAMDLNSQSWDSMMPSLDASFSLPSMDFNVPDVSISMPDISFDTSSFDTSSFDSGSSSFGSSDF